MRSWRLGGEGLLLFFWGWRRVRDGLEVCAYAVGRSAYVLTAWFLFREYCCRLQGRPQERIELLRSQRSHPDSTSAFGRGYVLFRALRNKFPNPGGTEAD